MNRKLRIHNFDAWLDYVVVCENGRLLPVQLIRWMITKSRIGKAE